MPILCNMRSNFPQQNVPLKAEVVIIIPVPWSHVLPGTLEATLASVSPSGEGNVWLFEPDEQIVKGSPAMSGGMRSRGGCSSRPAPGHFTKDLKSGPVKPEVFLDQVRPSLKN
eukprot:1158979-Pelagomonas_calceolata.AAC.1